MGNESNNQQDIQVYPKPQDIHVYPSDLQERPGGPVPLFLKLTYVGFTIFGILYFVLYASGDGSALVRAFNELTK